ncbi:MAG: SURF1 family protein [Paracoccaceae bacterium]
MTDRLRRLAAPVLLGVAGTATLGLLCLWQLDRLDWKLGLIDQLRARLSAEPSALPSDPTAGEHEFLRVRVAGRFPGEDGAHGHPDAPLLATLDKAAGYRIIQPFVTEDGRRIMVSRGWVPAEVKNVGGRAVREIPAPEGTVTLTGALRFPDDPQSPAFGERDNVWIARDLDVYERVFDVEPVLLVAETPTPGPETRSPVPQPLTVDLRNNHLGYAITWWLLGLVWAVMSTGWAVSRLRHGGPTPPEERPA